MHDIVDPDFVGDKLFFFFFPFFLIYRYVLSIFKMMSSQEKKKEIASYDTLNCSEIIYCVYIDETDIAHVIIHLLHFVNTSILSYICLFLHFEIFMQKKEL